VNDGPFHHIPPAMGKIHGFSGERDKLNHFLLPKNLFSFTNSTAKSNNPLRLHPEPSEKQSMNDTFEYRHKHTSWS
jgi:hypothetical protein